MKNSTLETDVVLNTETITTIRFFFFQGKNVYKARLSVACLRDVGAEYSVAVLCHVTLTCHSGNISCLHQRRIVFTADDTLSYSYQRKSQIPLTLQRYYLSGRITFTPKFPQCAYFSYKHT